MDKWVDTFYVLLVNNMFSFFLNESVVDVIYQNNKIKFFKCIEVNYFFSIHRVDER